MVSDKNPKIAVAKSLDANSVRQSLIRFLTKNPGCKVEEVEDEGGKQVLVTGMWGENALILYMPEQPDELIEALNSLYLPSQFTAIYHIDTNCFEAIWTAFPLSAPVKEVVGRKFQLTYAHEEYECEFGKSSDRLLLLAEHTRPVGQSSTNHRNLYSFHQHVRRKRRLADRGTEDLVIGEPYSFWIRSVNLDDEAMVSLAHHLNFYLKYYDYRSPTIIVHPPESDALEPRTRYIAGEFPNKIDAQSFDEDLLHLWHHSSVGDAGRRFIYCYRILEYVSHAYVERDIRNQIRRLLGSAHARAELPGFTDQVISVARSANADDVACINSMLKDSVDTSLVWQEISRNIAAFTQDVTFDGGFVQPAILARQDTEATFHPAGLQRFHTAARGIRNHLSHGRDKRTQASITPTVDNFNKLHPWVSVLSVVAGEVINFKNLL